MLPPSLLQRLAAAVLLATAAQAGGGCRQGLGCDGAGDDPFDCSAGVERSDVGWSDGKREWCCRVYRKGCSGRCTQGAGCNGEGSDPYDCEAGELRWEKGWSESKKDWCCENLAKGCSASEGRLGIASTAGEGPPYDCVSDFDDWISKWSDRQKSWCCQQDGSGCLVDERFDCDAGSLLWERGWSNAKKLWCCHAKNVGCQGTSPGNGSGGNSGWDQTHWVRYKGRDCTLGHGGVPMSNDTNPLKGNMLLQDCMEECLRVDGCEGFTFDGSVGSLGQHTSAPCFLRQQLDPRDCREDKRYDVYVYSSSGQGSWLGSGPQSFMGMSKNVQHIVIFLIIVVIAVCLLIALVEWFLWRRRKQSVILVAE